MNDLILVTWILEFTQSLVGGAWFNHHAQFLLPVFIGFECLACHLVLLLSCSLVCFGGDISQKSRLVFGYAINSLLNNVHHEQRLGTRPIPQWRWLWRGQAITVVTVFYTEQQQCRGINGIFFGRAWTDFFGWHRGWISGSAGPVVILRIRIARLKFRWQSSYGGKHLLSAGGWT